MIIPLKESEPLVLTEEEKERHYWDLLKYESHRWVEFSKGYYKCSFCDAIHTSLMHLGKYKICPENPNLK